MKISYSDFYKMYQKEKLLFENPLYAGNYNGYLNRSDVRDTRKKSIKDYDSFLENWNEFEIYRGDGIGENSIDFSFLYNDSLMATFTIKEYPDNGIEILSVWNEMYEGKGLARQIIFEYFLKKYNFILCGESHTEQGKQFWIKLISEAEKEGYKTFLFDLTQNNKKAIDSSYLKNHEKEIWGNNKQFLRLFIEK